MSLKKELFFDVESNMVKGEVAALKHGRDAVAYPPFHRAGNSA